MTCLQTCAAASRGGIHMQFVQRMCTQALEPVQTSLLVDNVPLEVRSPNVKSRFAAECTQFSKDDQDSWA